MGARTKPEHIAWNRDLAIVLFAILQYQESGDAELAAHADDSDYEPPDDSRLYACARDVAKLVAPHGIEKKRTEQLIDALLITRSIIVMGEKGVTVPRGPGRFVNMKVHAYAVHGDLTDNMRAGVDALRRNDKRRHLQKADR